MICGRCKKEIKDNKCGCYPFFPLIQDDEEENEVGRNE